MLGAVGLPEAGLVVALLSLWVLWTHRENIARLRAGTEPKIGQSKVDGAKADKPEASDSGE